MEANMGELLAFPKQAEKRAPTKKIALTDDRVAKLTGEGLHWDKKVDGLVVRITEAGGKSYVFRRQIHGRLVNITLGKTSGLKVEDARKTALKLNGETADGKDVRAERKALRARTAKKAPTLAEAFEAFKAARERRPSTVVDHEFLWGRVPTSMKRKLVADITSDDVEAAKQIEMKAGRSRTAAKLVVFLTAILNAAGRKHDNPASDVKRPAPNRRTRRLDRDELAAFLKVLEARRGQFWPDFIAVALMTGARRAALQAMQWEDLHLDDALWTVPAEWSKNKTELAIALPTKAVEVLKARKNTASSQWVWPSDDAASGHVSEPRKPLDRLLAEAGVKAKLSMHDLRRTVGSRLAMTGANAATISAALGHLSQASAKAYVHLTTEPVRAAIEKALGLEGR
jgi:integrase